MILFVGSRHISNSALAKKPNFRRKRENCLNKGVHKQ